MKKPGGTDAGRSLKQKSHLKWRQLGKRYILDTTNNLVPASREQGKYFQTYHRSRNGKTQIDLLERIAPNIARTHSHDQLAGVFGDMTGAENQILDNRAQSAALGAFPYGRPVLQGFLSNHAEKVVGQNGQFQYKAIGSKLT